MGRVLEAHRAVEPEAIARRVRPEQEGLVSRKHAAAEHEPALEMRCREPARGHVGRDDRGLLELERGDHARAEDEAGSVARRGARLEELLGLGNACANVHGVA